MDNDNSSTQFTTGGAHGIIPIYTRRNEIVYGVFETELDTLSNYNSFSTFFFSLGAFFIEKVVNWGHGWSSLVDYKNPFFLVSIFCIFLGGIFFWKKRGLTEKIKRNSTQVTYPL